MSDVNDRKVLTLVEAEAMLPHGERVHTFRNSAVGLLLGTHWDKADILEAFKKYPPELSGPSATSMKHGIVLIDEAGPLFVETAEDTNA